MKQETQVSGFSFFFFLLVSNFYAFNITYDECLYLYLYSTEYMYIFIHSCFIEYIHSLHGSVICGESLD